MERISTTPRPDWQKQVESTGLTFHTIGNTPYWDERACYHFKMQEIEALKTATNEIEKLCMELVEHVIQFRRYEELNIPEYAWSLIELSWRRGDKPLYGRMDFSYDGDQPPKLLEYNAATPLCLLESSRVQRQWLEQVYPSAGQYNSIHERLVAAWLRYTSGRIHLTCRDKLPVLYYDLLYLAKTAFEAGFAAKLVFIEKIFWNGKEYVDEENETINTLFKLCSWEWMLEEVFGRLEQANTLVIEPAWKMILANKAVMVLLWELFPDHPNLLPTYFDPKKMKGNYVKKPLLGREGQNITLHINNDIIATTGIYKEGPFVYQQAHELPNFNGNYPMIGSWLIAGEAAGIIIREDETLITRSLSRIVPHFFD